MNKTLLLEAVFREDTGYIPSDEKVSEALSRLSDRERFVIERRFRDQPMTREALGKIFPRHDGGIGVTRERVRQCEAKAIRKLRHPSRARLLWPASR